MKRKASGRDPGIRTAILRHRAAYRPTFLHYVEVIGEPARIRKHVEEFDNVTAQIEAGGPVTATELFGALYELGDVRRRDVANVSQWDPFGQRNWIVAPDGAFGRS